MCPCAKPAGVFQLVQIRSQVRRSGHLVATTSLSGQRIRSGYNEDRQLTKSFEMTWL
jgi:hypothetical protein